VQVANAQVSGDDLFAFCLGGVAPPVTALKSLLSLQRDNP